MQKLSQVFLATGSDRFRLSEYIDSMKKGAAAKYGDFAVQSFSYPQYSLSALRSELFAPAFLSEKRVLFVSGLPWGAADKISDEDKELCGTLLLQLADLPDDVVVFFVASTPDKRTKFFKLLSTVAFQVQDFPEWDMVKQKSEYIQWIVARAQYYGTSISSAVAGFLLEYSGYSLEVLNTELQKLAMLRYGSKIEKPDILDLAVACEESVDFAFSNALASADPVVLVKELDTLCTEFSAPELFNRDIVPSFRNLLKVGLSTHYKTDLGLNPYVVKKLQPIFKKYSLSSFRQIYLFLKDLDVGSKTGKYTLTPDSRAFVVDLQKHILSVFL